MAEVEFLEKLGFLLFESARIKVAFGGRGAGKSEGCAIALILLSRTKKLRILCAREIQSSIDESVKETIEANIVNMGFENEFIFTKKQIVCKRTGSRFIFMGLRFNINKVKSLGRIDICWVEEADKVSKSTIDKLLPTIRGRSKFEEDKGGPFGNGPEIWWTFNPDLDTDEVYKQFVLQRDKYCPEWVKDEQTGEQVRYSIIQKINYWDNKWFPDDLRLQMQVMRSASEDKYLEVWEGHTKIVIEGAIYADELRQVIREGRRGKVPYDPSKPVYTFWDLGHSDKTAIWFIQRVGLEYNVINFYQNNLKKLAHYLEVMQSLNYVYGTVYQPHDADNETLASRSIAKLTRDAGYKVIVVQRPTKKANGINAARTVFPLCNFDEENTADGWQCLSRYGYKVDEDDGTFSREPEHDTPWSHGADAWQTFALSLKTEQETKKPTNRERAARLKPIGNNDWMGRL